MNVHKNARLTPLGRERLVKQVLERVLTPAAASVAAGVSLRTAYKWLSRFRNEGSAGLRDRRSRPKRLRCSLSLRQRERIEHLRRERRPYREIAKLVRASLSTIARHVCRCATTSAWASGSLACSPTTASATSGRACERPGIKHPSPARIDPRPTAKRSAS
jgi:transposase-like protein